MLNEIFMKTNDIQEKKWLQRADDSAKFIKNDFKKRVNIYSSQPP